MLRVILLAFALTLSAAPVAAGTIDDAIAAFNLGDYKTAVQLFRPLAERGDAVAQTALGVMYHDGIGVPQDYPQAARWWRKAANQGNAKAQVLLGGLYFKGHGVPQDYVLSHMWFNLSTAQGMRSSFRDKIAKLMTSEQIAEAQRLAREWKPK
jgi:TPR repeat protein